MKIMIDSGHGGSDPGATSKIVEKDYALAYGLELSKFLNFLGFEVGTTRNTDEFVSLAGRPVLANNWGADYFISIHFNAGGGSGIETYALASGGQGEKLARAVQSAVIAQTGIINRGVKFANFQVLRETNMPAILIEGGFVDSSDADKIATEIYKQKFVRGVSKGICDITGVAWKDYYGVTSAPVVEAVVASDKAQAVELLKQAIKVLEG